MGLESEIDQSLVVNFTGAEREFPQQILRCTFVQTQEIDLAYEKLLAFIDVEGERNRIRLPTQGIGIAKTMNCTNGQRMKAL